MKAQTQIEQAVKAWYDAFAEYARVVEGIPVKPTHPKVTWVKGSLKDEGAGWVIDGRHFNMTADEVIVEVNKQAAKWWRRINKHTGVSYGEQMTLPETIEQPAGGGGYE